MQTDPATEQRRHLTLTGTYNLRDVGGYATADGRATRWRTLLRADSLHRLDQQGQQELLDLGLRTIIDLRRPDEATRFPNVLAAAPGVRYLQLSLHTEDPEQRAVLPTLPQIYRHILNNAGAQLGTIVATLAAPGALPALIHCQVGKDRTGVAIALLLGAVGVPRETIVADYARSGPNLAGAFTEQVRQALLAEGRDWERFAPLLLSPTEFMAEMLDSLDTAHGGSVGYLRAVGVRDEQLAALRLALTE